MVAGADEKTIEAGARVEAQGGFVMPTEVVILILMLVAWIALDLAAPRWGADSRRLDPQAFTAN